MNRTGVFFLTNTGFSDTTIRHTELDSTDQTAADTIRIHTLDNGLTIAVQAMPWLRTAAFSLSLQAGIHAEGDADAGLASLVCEMVQRGAGNFSSRDLVAVQDNLGMDRSSGVSSAMVSFGATMPAASLDEAISIYADVVRRPHLPADQFDDARMMLMQELRAIEDEPTQRVMIALRAAQYGERLGRGPHGTRESLSAFTSDHVRDFYINHYHARGGILAIAGNVNIDSVIDHSEKLFGDWKSGEIPSPAVLDGQPGVTHFQSSSSQTHIGFSFDSIPFGHDDYFKMRAAIGILSDGMSSRLFDRVREQRGLCYTVSASCHSLKNTGGVFGYAGTTPERAQETLDVTLGEFNRFAEGLAQDELDRWKVRIQSNLIMEQESSASRASSIASDYYQLGRVLTNTELEAMIEALTLDEVRDYWLEHQPSDYRVVTLGQAALKLASVR